MTPPSEEAVRRAREIAADLLDIATGGYGDSWRTWDKPEMALSQSDRLVIIAGRLGRISELLRFRYEDTDLSGSKAAGPLDSTDASQVPGMNEP